MSTAVLSALFFLAALSSPANAADKTELSEQDKRDFVIAHNRLRQTAFPKAITMNFVVWNCRLEALAIKMAKLCKFDHSPDVGEYAGLGENIYKGFKNTGGEISLTWFSEKSKHNHLNDTCHSGVSCGHYRQIMSESTTEIGCGLHRCGANNYEVFCEYNGGSSGFAYGAPCSQCSKERPFCLNGLCLSKELTTNMQVLKEFDSTVTAKSIECKLACKNCGKRVDSAGECKCECAAGTKGTVCETKEAGFKDTACSPCLETPPCLNGGTEDKSDAAKCKCSCTSGFVGNRCEIGKDSYDSSVKLVIASKDPYSVSGKYVVMPPVSRALLNSKIWTNLQTELANAVNGYCRTAANFVKCCTGKTFPGDATKVASAAHISASDLKFLESTFENTLDGSLNFHVYAEVSSSALCAAATTRRKRAATKYVPQSVLLDAITAANDGTISPKLTACCQNVLLKQVERASYAFGSAEVASNRKVDYAIPSTSNGTYECSSVISKISMEPKPKDPNAGNRLSSTMLSWCHAVLLLAFRLRS